MKTIDIIEELNAMVIDDTNEDEMIERVDMLMQEISKNDDGQMACEAMINLLERHPHADFGGPGAIIHTIEDHMGHYEKFLFESLNKRPADTTVMLLERIINAEKDPSEIKRLLKIFKDCAKHPLADKPVKHSVKQYLSYRKKHSLN